jgi:hypothetical protein
MAYPTYSPENRLLEFLRDENTTPFFVGTLAALRGLRGLSQSRLSAVVRGRGLEHDAAKALAELVSKLERLRDAVAPIPVRFHNAADINELITKTETGELLVVAATRSSEELNSSAEEMEGGRHA